MITTMRAYRFALDLTPAQTRAVLGHAGAARKAYNWAFGLVKAVLDQRASERSYGLAQTDLTPAVGWSFPALRRAWNQAKGEVALWWADYSKEAFNTGLDGLAHGLKNWSESQAGSARAGTVVVEDLDLAGCERSPGSRRIRWVSQSSSRSSTRSTQVPPQRQSLPRKRWSKLVQPCRPRRV